MLGNREMEPTLEDVFILLRLEVKGPDVFCPERIPSNNEPLKQNLQDCGRLRS